MSAKKTLTKIAQEKLNKQVIAQELVDKIEGMVADMNKKCAAAKEQLVENLKITADKYFTATGAMEALRVLRQVNDGKVDGELDIARNLAMRMHAVTMTIADNAANLDYEDMEKICEGVYDEEFIGHEFDFVDLAYELMRLDLCRNVGPAAEDMVEFYKRAAQEITDTQKELDKIVEKYPEFGKLTPTAKE